MTGHRFWTRFAVPACALLLALAGCSGDNLSGPGDLTQADADDIAAQAGQALAASVITNMAAADGASGGVSGSPAARFDAGARGPNRALGFAAAAETTFTVGGVTYTLTVAFYDAGGNELASYGPAASRMVASTRATGSISDQQFTATLGHAGSLDVIGIEAPEDTLTFQGASNDSVEASFRTLDGTQTRYFKWIGAAALMNVRLAENPQVNPYPISGTAMYSVHAERYRTNELSQLEKTWDAIVVVVFDGTAQPELTVNSFYRYRMNLVNGAVVRM